jgi:hypothetical protein
MLKIGLRAALVLVLSFFAAAGTKASAQSRSSQNIEIDCSAFQRQSDGSWIALHTTTIKIGTNSLTVSGKVGGSVNGLDIQEAMTRQCSKEQRSGGGGTYANTNWKKTPQSSSECVARGRELVQGFPWKQVAGETVFAASDGYMFLIRCTPQNMIFFAVVGPPDSNDERDKAAQGLFDRVFGPVVGTAQRRRQTERRGRDASYLAPPAQNRTCGFPAYGSHLGCVTARLAAVRRFYPA